MSKRIAEENLINELNRVSLLLKRIPSYEDMRNHGIYSPACYQRRYKSWENVKKLLGWEEVSINIDDISPLDGSWLSGIIDGEGCFRIQKPSKTSGNGLSKSFAPMFTLSLRMDDKDTIDEIQRIIGTAKGLSIDLRKGESFKGMKNPSPAYKLNIRDLPILAYRLIPILDHYPLRSKKKNDFVLFKMAVNILLEKRNSGRRNFGYTDNEREMLNNLYLALGEIKKFGKNIDDIIKEFNL